MSRTNPPGVARERGLGTNQARVVHLLVAMPVLPNQGIIFDSLQPGDAETHVNHRKPETWVVSFRGGPNGPDTGHYRNPIAAAEAIIDRHHNAGKNN